ncbi:MAG TPA: DUF4232 domain-containing protein [Gaiellales bacterium]
MLVTAAGVGAAGAAAAHASAASAASTPRCRLNQLSLAAPKMNGAAGTIRLRYVFTNTGGATCSLFGFPGMQMLNKNQSPIPTHVYRGTGHGVPPEPETTVVMTPGQHGSFYAGFSDVPTGNEKCPTSAYMEVTPPNDFNHFTQKEAIAPCGGHITVSPVVHGRLPVF